MTANKRIFISFLVSVIILGVISYLLMPFVSLKLLVILACNRNGIN